MAIRYIIRRPQAEQLEDIEAQVAQLTEKLGQAQKDTQRNLEVVFDARRSACYHFQARKTEAGWAWVCPSIELVADNEKELIALTDQFAVNPPSHLAHFRN